MPTTAGTGSEATKNAVISSRARGFKKSLRSPLLLPPLALIDPELTASCPRPVTVASGMDAITQLLESCISVRATPMSQALSWQGMRGTLAALREAAHHPQSRAPREQMALAALLSGMALANSGLGLAHGVAASLGIHCGVAHGLACAVMLPVAIQVNREVAAVPLAEAAATLLERNFDTPERAIDELQAELSTLYEELGLPRRLGELGVPRDQISAIARDSFGNSMSGNPQSLTPPELSELLHANW
jgi:alcohol dehydrogenase class IV